jgi:hypothetical protein
MYRICTSAIKVDDIDTAKKFLMLLKSQKQTSASDILQAAIVEFHLCLYNKDANGAEDALKTVLTKHTSLDGAAISENAEYLRLLSRVTIEVCAVNNMSLAKSCLCRIIEITCSSPEGPDGLYIDHVFRNYLNVILGPNMGSSAGEIPSPEDHIDILSQGLQIIDKFKVDSFSSDPKKRAEIFLLLAG